MKQIKKQTIKQILEIPEKQIIDRIVYNLNRKGFYDTFDKWFDNKEKLNIKDIYDCYSGLKFAWSTYGNLSKAISYVDFLGQKENLIEEHSFEGGNHFRGMHKYPDEVDTQVFTLGSYRRMRSPGLITINIDNIQVCFWSIIFKLVCERNYKFTREKTEELAKLFFYKTLYHELFHHYIDVQSHLSENYKYDFATDEALAVAFSRILVGYETKFNHTYISEFLDLSYSYNLVGYKDWVNYKSEEQFLIKVIDYIAIDVNLINKGQETLPIVEALIYAIVESPNVEVFFNNL